MFEEALTESYRQKREAIRGMSLPLSVALHAAVIGATFAASPWFVEDAGDPPVPIVFHQAGPPPPPGNSAVETRQSGSRGHAATVPKPFAVIQAFHSPGETGPASATSEPGPGQGGESNPEGVDGGTGQRGDGEAGAGELVSTAIPITRDVTPPQLIVRVEPEYPEIARKLRREGTVILEAVITVGGGVDEVRLLKSADPLLDEAARRAVLQWRYRAASLNGRAVSVYLTVTVTFHLR